jgi:hypothetical protein
MRGFVTSCAAVILAAAGVVGCAGTSPHASRPSATSNNGGGPSRPGNDLSRLVANADKQRFKIRFTDGSGSTQTYEQDGNGDSVSGSAGTLTFATKTSTTICDQINGTYQCTQSPVSPDAALNPFSGVATAFQSQLSALGGRYGAQSTATIAGRDAQCVTFLAADFEGPLDQTITTASAAPPQASYSYCIDSETGVTLKVAVTDASGKQTTSLLVTKFALPKASDFTPPTTPSNTTPALAGTGGS